MIGRPSLYSKEICDQICEAIATSSVGLHTLCKNNPDFPSYTTIFSWLGNPDYSDFKDNYARAREAQTELLIGEIIEIADDGSKDNIIIPNDGNPYTIEDKEWTSRSKLRVDSRKFIASKLLPKKYGDKLDITSKGEQIGQTFQIGFDKPEKDGESKAD